MSRVWPYGEKSRLNELSLARVILSYVVAVFGFIES